MITKKIKLDWFLAQNLLLMAVFVIAALLLTVRVFFDGPIKFGIPVFEFIFGVIVLIGIAAAIFYYDPDFNSSSKLESKGFTDPLNTNLLDDPNSIVANPFYSHVAGNIYHSSHDD